ncbi:hypothetical protein JYB62_08495 [Algoriphagus lutimaris]|uniref:PLAT/LH2 domain-containing protein n=1 Tax=Algoriphagus lutimaris TaxID=613197 RepID=UPI00196BA6DC|nr:PLAT/LH2 domain-containing protein [Algoriphagus lutimaris]MBN3520041.1 hypothetical protein [Algoriphagus lutimaris]
MRETTYTVEVKTGHKGTNADIEIFLIGTKGMWKDFQLMDNPGRDDFEPNQTDVFHFIDDNDIGIVTDIALRPRGPGLYHDNWKMDSIKIKSDAEGSKETRFGERKRLFTGEAEPVYLRAESFIGSKLAEQSTETRLKNEYVIVENNFGGNAPKDRILTDEIIDIDKLTNTDENLTSIKQSYEIKKSISAPIDIVKVEASMTFAGEIATAFKNQVTSEKQKQKRQLTSQKYEGLDYHCNFFFYKEYEILAVGSLNNSFLSSPELKSVIKEHKTVEVKSFKAIDQVLNGSNESFAELWNKYGKGPMPNSPKLADLT